MEFSSDQLRFAAMLAKSGMDVPPDQLPSLFEGYRHMIRHIALLAAPLAREAEPALIFIPEVE